MSRAVKTAVQRKWREAADARRSSAVARDRDVQLEAIRPLLVCEGGLRVRGQRDDSRQLLSFCQPTTLYSPRMSLMKRNDLCKHSLQPRRKRFW
jgi:hypothetical protein